MVIETPKSIHEVLMFDYDGTLTLAEAQIPEPTKRVLDELKDKRVAIMGIVSGRQLEHLKSVNEDLGMPFSFLVAENGAVSHFCDTQETHMIGKEWAINAKQVFAHSDFPIRFFEVMGTSRREYADQVESVLRKSGLDAKITPNKDSVMVLPPSVDKGTGVSTAVAHYGSTSSIYLTCFGDGENDLALFAPADFRVAVANSVPALKEVADVVTDSPGGLGVEEYLRKRYFESETVDSRSK